MQAMYLQVPVIAVNSGGPRETVLSGTTGFLCEQVGCVMHDIVYSLFSMHVVIVRYLKSLWLCYRFRGSRKSMCCHPYCAA